MRGASDRLGRDWRLPAAAVAAMTGWWLLAWSPAAGGVLSGMPRRIDPRADYLIYLHGRIVEEHGPYPTDPRFGAYEYQGILEALAARGFAVIGEVRPQGTAIASYADHVVAQVRSLLAAGVPPRRIAVVGFSKGGAIALVAASRLHHPEVRFVSLAGCGDWLFKQFKLDLTGPVLSLYDEADDLATSCGQVLSAGSNAAQRREILLHVGKGHGTFYRPDPAWLDPLAAWLAASGAAPPRQASQSGGVENPCRLALRQGTVCETAGYTIASYVRRGGRGGGAAAQLAAELAGRTLGVPGAPVAALGE